jgi:hypothetical protein
MILNSSSVGTLVRSTVWNQKAAIEGQRETANVVLKKANSRALALALRVSLYKVPLERVFGEAQLVA